MKKNTFNIINLIIALIAIGIATKSYMFSSFVYKNQQEDKLGISISEMKLEILEIDKFNINSNSLPDFIELRFDITISNIGDRDLSIIDFVIKGPFFLDRKQNEFSGMLTDDKNLKLKTPFMLKKGESRKLKLIINPGNYLSQDILLKLNYDFEFRKALTAMNSDDNMEDKINMSEKSAMEKVMMILEEKINEISLEYVNKSYINECLTTSGTNIVDYDSQNLISTKEYYFFKYTLNLEFKTNKNFVFSDDATFYRKFKIDPEKEKKYKDPYLKEPDS